MSDKVSKILNIVTVVLLVVCFVKIGSLQTEIQNLKYDVQNSRSTLQSSINAISSNVAYEMEQANNLLSDSSFNARDIDTDKKTAIFHCYVVPKVYNPEKTTAAIICNGNEVPMMLENGRYVAQFEIPLFDDCTIANVQFKEDGAIRTQQLDWVINPRYDLVPTAYIYYSGSSSHNYSGKDITRSYSGAVEIDFEHKGFAGDLSNAEIVLLVNGKEQWRSKTALEELYMDDYMAHYRGDIEYSFDVKKGDTIKMYAEIVDKNGWKYRTVLEDITISEKGNPVDNGEYHSEAEIYDADGNLLFQPYKY